MSADRIQDLLDLNNVPRWNSRVRLLRRQTVAEHTFNVMAISCEIVCRLDTGPTEDSKHRILYRVLRWALVHDAPECETGDINYLFKRHFDRAVINDMEDAVCPWYKFESQDCPPWARAIVKIADKVEEYHYILKWTEPSEAAKWIPGILQQVQDHVNKAYAEYGWRNLTNIVLGVLGIPIDSATLGLKSEINPDSGNLNQHVAGK